MVKVKIKATVITAQYGTLSSGDILTTNEAFAKHLVEECAAAEYLTAVKDEKPLSNESEAEAERKPAGKSKKAV